MIDEENGKLQYQIMNNLPDSSNVNNTIIKNVESSIVELCSEYLSNPSRFFTEKDFVCRFYNAFHKRMGDYSVKDVQGNKHSIFHTEYPTPFRVDMKGSNCIVRGEHDRTDKGGLYRRGHYDVVIMNPNMIKQLSLKDVRSQEYRHFKENVLSKINADNPLILYGLEFLYERGNIKTKSFNNFCEKVYQDHKKLLISTRPEEWNGCSGFIINHKTIAFFESDKFKDRICSTLKNNSIHLVMPSSLK